MPNYVTNLVYAKNMETLLNTITREDSKEGVIVDFNMLIPMPKDLDITSGSGSYLTANPFNLEMVERQTKYVDTILKKIYKPTMTREQFVSAVKNIWEDVKDNFAKVYPQVDDFTKCENILYGYHNVQKYGSTDWYEWCWKHWGTKWNACSPSIFDRGVQFDTAWSCPVPLLKELSKHTPILVTYADEDTGSNYGIYTFNKGKEKVVLDDTRKSTAEALLCRGADEDYLYDYFGEDCYTDDEIEDYFGISREEVIKRELVDFRKAESILQTALSKLGR